MVLVYEASEFRQVVCEDRVEVLRGVSYNYFEAWGLLVFPDFSFDRRVANAGLWAGRRSRHRIGRRFLEASWWKNW